MLKVLELVQCYHKMEYVAFMSQAFSSARRVKSVYERELLAIMKTVSKWKHYLTEHDFGIKIDQRSLKHLI